MKKIASFLLVFLLLPLGFWSCKKDKTVTPDAGYNYFPNQVGRYVVYDVDSLYYDQNNDLKIFTNSNNNIEKKNVSTGKKYLLRKRRASNNL